MLLDQAEYRMDGGPWQPREEVLRVDNLLREALGYPLKMAAFPQPWTLHGQGRRRLRRLACFCSFHRRSWGRLALGHCPNRRLYWREKLDRSEKPAKEAASVTA